MATLLALSAGASLGQKASPVAPPPSITVAQTSAIVASPTTLSALQKRSIRTTYAWFDRDAPILEGVIVPQTIFVETIGVKERSGYLNVQVKSRPQMITELTREYALRQIAHRDQTSTAANIHRAGGIGGVEGAFESTLARADQRIIEARARLAPALREGYRDVDMYSIRIPDGLSAELAAQALMDTGDYEFASMDWRCFPADTVPNDPLIASQWHHTSDRIDSYGAWDFTQGNTGTIIGVCDSGVDLDHPDLAAALVPGYNAVDNLAQVDGGNVNDDLVGHGSRVAGSAAAIGNNATGVSGVGWNFGIMPIKVSNSPDGSALLSNILEGARWASDHGAYASNCSFAGAEDSSVRSTGGHLRVLGHLLVFAAGNDSVPNQVNDWAKVTIVGASDQADNLASFSNTGIGIDCIAPGVNIRTTNRIGGYAFATGTSFSTPIVSGALMLVHDANPALSADEVEFILLNSSDDKQAIGQDDESGWGRINLGQAINDAIFGPSITSLPFEDPFADPTLSTDWRNPVGDVIVSQDGLNEPSAPNAMNLDDADSIETIPMRASILAGGPGEIHFSTEHRGVEDSESLTIDYFSVLNTWITLATISSDGIDQENFTLHRLLVPPFAMHDQFKLRFTANGSDTSDDWYIDDVGVEAFTSNSLPWEDGFEDGITLTLDWAASTATASTEAINEPDGSMSALLNNQDSMTSAEVDVSQSLEALYYRFYTEHRGVELAETLFVEYKTLQGVWKPLLTIESDGVDQDNFELTQVLFPAEAYGGTTALRLSAQGDQSDDAWFIDRVAITSEMIVEQGCPGDLNNDGVVDFFDVSAFLSAFATQDPIADFSSDGIFDFFDVSAFLGAFAQGCP